MSDTSRMASGSDENLRLNSAMAAAAGQDSDAETTAPADAVNQGAFDKSTWKYGPAWEAPAPADIVDIVREREHELRRQAGSFRLDIEALPLAEPGAWVVGPDTVVVSWSLRDDHAAFREWFEPLVAALV